MADPVMVATGHTYDRVCIERWLAQGNRTCPVTGMRLRHLELTPNFALRNAIQVRCRILAHSVSVDGPGYTQAQQLPVVFRRAHSSQCRPRRSGLRRMRSWCRTERTALTPLCCTSLRRTSIPPTSCRRAVWATLLLDVPAALPRPVARGRGAILTGVAAAGCRGMTRLCGRWRLRASACSQHQPTRQFACGTSSRGAVSRSALPRCSLPSTGQHTAAACCRICRFIKKVLLLAQVLEDHTRPVLSLAVTDRKLFSGSYDYTIKVWSLDSLQRLKTLTGATRVLG